MNPINFHGANKVYVAPASWDEGRDGACADLHVMEQDGFCYSLWRPTPEELEMLNNGGVFMMGVAGQQPVVNLGISIDYNELPPRGTTVQ